MLQSILSQKIVVKAVGGAVGLGLLAFPDETSLGLAGAGAAGIVYAGYWATDWLIEFPHRWKWISPLHSALCGPLGVNENAAPGSYIKIRRNYMKREEVGKILLPPQYTGIDQTTPTHIVKAKLGLTDASVSFRMAGRKPHLVVRQTPRPPGKVMFGSYKSQVVAAKESAPLIGIGPQGKQVQVDLDAESPHILVSASTGGGKSVITRTMSCQMLHNGAQMVVLDYKRHSHRWARALDSVHYCKDIADIHDALVALGREGHRRNKIVDDWEGDDEPDVGPRMIVLLEESNSTMAKLKKHWMAVRTKEDPKASPALEALGEVLFMGRAVKMHVLLVAQSATAAALGGPEYRECFATRILARYTQNAWRMLVPEVHPIPRSTRHTGRAQVVLGGVATETQVLFMTDQEASEWAVSGVQAPPPSLSRDTHRTPPTREDARDSHADVTPGLVLIKGGKTYNLAEASREEIIPMTADALRQAKRRDPRFPEGSGGRWTAEELQEWYRDRQSS